MTPGTSDLPTLLKTMSPELSDESFVFLSLAPDQVPPDLKAAGTFREAEGLTIICEKSEAMKHGFAFQGSYRRITLSVHSSLDAVGFLSRIARELTRANISCNVISAFYHDHLFIQESAAEDAMQVLSSLGTSD